MTFEKFYQQYQTLTASFPKRPNTITESEDSPYGNHIFRCNKMYFGFDSAFCEKSFYIYDGFKLLDCIDCMFTAESELCHECVDGYQCYDCTMLEDCAQCSRCAWCIWSKNCKDCFGCVALNAKRYCFFNRQLTEEGYKAKLKEYAVKTQEEIRAELEALRRTIPRPPVHMLDNENTDHGNYYYYNSDSYYLFDATRNEGCGYMFDAHRNKQSFDFSFSYDSELCYECVDVSSSYECFFGHFLDKCRRCLFSLDCSNCDQCMGCAYLSSKRHCILNKQYEPEEYRKQAQEILATFEPALLMTSVIPASSVA